MWMAFSQELREMFTVGNMMSPFFGGISPGIIAGYIIGKSGNEAAIPYVFVGAVLLANWTQGIGRIGRSLQSEQFQGTLDLLITTRTPVVIVLMGKALAITALGLIPGVVVFAIVLGFTGGLPSVENLPFLAVSVVLAFVSMIAASFVFSPIAFLAGARGGFFNAIMPFGSAVSGFLYPTALLPFALELIALCLPTAWAMDAVVRSIEGGANARILEDWGMALLTIGGTLALSVYLMSKAERRIRFTGNLGR
jgi:ABC-type polysaccharide/polyol phosphate export permease